jgi:hypothetical protein
MCGCIQNDDAVPLDVAFLGGPRLRGKEVTAGGGVGFDLISLHRRIKRKQGREIDQKMQPGEGKIEREERQQVRTVGLEIFDGHKLGGLGVSLGNGSCFNRIKERQRLGVEGRAFVVCFASGFCVCVMGCDGRQKGLRQEAESGVGWVLVVTRCLLYGCLEGF